MSSPAVMRCFSLTSSVYGLVHSVVAGGEVVLSCPAPGPWLLCVWLGPSGERRCQVRLGGEEEEEGLVRSEEVCGAQEAASSVLTSTDENCQLRLSGLVAAQHGVWTCMMTLDTAGQFQTLVTRLVLSVTSPPSLALSHNSSHLTCSAGDGYPAPALRWTLDDSIPLLPDQVKGL